MFKSFKSYSFSYFHYFLIFLFFSTTYQSIAYADTFADSYIVEEATNYEEYGEFAEILKIFEDEVESQEEIQNIEFIAKGFLSHWTKNLKYWFLKSVKKVLKKTLKLTNCSNPEDCAYTAAKFKRKIDKVCNTGSIENVFSHFDQKIPVGKKIDSFEHFKGRIKYYYKNKHARPPSSRSSNPYHFLVKQEARDDLKNIPPGALVGGVEVFCGVLIGILPLPGCQYLGSLLAGDGFSRIISSYIDDGNKPKLCLN